MACRFVVGSRTDDLQQFPEIAAIRSTQGSNVRSAIIALSL